MGKYNFDEMIDRRGTGSLKWDSDAEDVIPMWVADMDFRTAPGIVDAIVARAHHGVFGYSKVPADYYAAVADWSARRHGFHIAPEWILTTTGIVPALSAIVMAFAEPGDKVLIQEPVYNCFFSSVRNMRCEAVSNDLIYAGGKYSVDFEDFERKASDPAVRVFLLCSPHNPAGRVWTLEELTRMGEICLRHNVIVVADEIHCDLVFPGHRHVPFASISDDFLQNSVTCTAPSKTFNLAGCQAANIIAANPALREKVDRALNINEVGELNSFGIVALRAAYTTGEEWLEELKIYLRGNYDFLVGYFRENLPALHVVPLEATYLVWVDCRALGKSSAEIAKAIEEKGRVWVNRGTMYGQRGEEFIRINIACPRQTLVRGLEGIRKALGQD